MQRLVASAVLIRLGQTLTSVRALHHAQSGTQDCLLATSCGSSCDSPCTHGQRVGRIVLCDAPRFPWVMGRTGPLCERSAKKLRFSQAAGGGDERQVSRLSEGLSTSLQRPTLPIFAISGWCPAWVEHSENAGGHATFCGHSSIGKSHLTFSPIPIAVARVAGGRP